MQSFCYVIRLKKIIKKSCRTQSCHLLMKIKLLKMSIKYILKGYKKNIRLCLNFELKCCFVCQKCICRNFYIYISAYFMRRPKVWGAAFCFCILCFSSILEQMVNSNSTCKVALLFKFLSVFIH